MTIREARFPDDADTLRGLFRAYVQWLGLDLDFQGFEDELTTLPGKYVPPQGIALLAEDAEGQVLGCVAMRPLSNDICEMKRLYLRPEARGHGVANALCQRLITAAQAAGYRRMVLDTLDHMQDALRLYARLGFNPTPAYYDNPLPGVVYLGRDLTDD